MTFSASIFTSIFSSIFNGKWLPKWSISYFRGDHFGSLFATFFEDRFFTLRACPPTQLILSGNSRSVTKLSRRPYVASTRCRSLWGDPWGGRGRGQGKPRAPKGAQREPKGAFGALGGMGPWDPLGSFRSYPEWKAISSGPLIPLGEEH